MRKIKKKLVGLLLTVAAAVTTALPVLASTETTTVTYSDLTSVVDVLKNQISVTTIIGVIAGIGAVCVGLVFFWWGLRKVIRMVMSAFKKGKFSA